MNLEVNSIIDCKGISECIINDAKERMYRPKTLAIVTVGDDESSKVYVERKKRKLTEIGCCYKHISLSSFITIDYLVEVIEELNLDDNVNGIIVQQPLPKHLQKEIGRITSAISSFKDVDGFSPVSKFRPCTPLGIIRMIELSGLENKIRNTRVVIAGRSNLVGLPLQQMLMEQYNCTVTIIHSHTDKEYVKELLSNCDVFVSAIGRPYYWTREYFENCDRQRTLLVDVGITRMGDGKVVGDCNPEIHDLFAYYTPVPKGVGLTTVACLIENLSRT